MSINLKRFFKENNKILIISFIISVLIGILNLKRIGIKDSSMMFLATFVLIIEIYLIFKDMKKSMLLFIISLPILVTARKVCYFDLLFVKIAYESIYVTILFVYNLKNIIKGIRECKNYKSSLFYRFYFIILMFLIFVYNSNIYSINVSKSLSDTYFGVVVPIMFMLCAIEILKKEDIKEVIFCLVISIDFSCLYGMMQLLKDGISFRIIIKNRAFLTFGYHNVNIFAAILVTIMPLLLEMVLYKKLKNKKEKIFAYSSLLLQGAALIITFTRGAWLCFIASIFLLLISKKYKKLLIVFIVAGLILAKPALSFIISRGTGNTTLLTNESSVARIQSIFTDINIIKKYPFGIGMSNFAHKYKEFAGVGYLSMPEKFRWKVTAAHYMLEHAHNLLLQIGVEFGIVSLILFIMLLINRVKVMLKDYEQNRGLFVSLIIYTIISTMTGNEFNHKGVITGTLIIFLVFALIQINNKGKCYTKQNKNIR
ncbi:O-antigen ligase family protein [Haloimpatiens sp. FM7330]|uniref:O-antigen ligase family protein n=1 Tax=Haloimpatiens sp. FM7330 TaxID=3298610 RepID=UPI00362E2664